MSNWSHLPQDLLLQIAKCLENHFDLLHFRAVCPPWRASAPSNLVPPPSYSPSPVGRSDQNGEQVVLLKRTISLFKFPQLHNQTIPHFWLVKLEQDDESGGKIRILDPLSSGTDLKQVKKCPIVLNSSRFHPQDLAHEYVLTDEDGTVAEKASHMNTNGSKTFLLFGDNDEDLGLFKLGDEVPNQIEIEGWSSGYDDFIQFNGKFYAVDICGRAVAIEHHSGTMTPASDKLTIRGEKNFLVELGRNLLLVTRLSGAIEGRKTCLFQVYQLDEERKIWDRVRSLGDVILFLGKYCNFSVAGIPGVQGNCIVVYSYEIFNADDDTLKRRNDAYVFHMGSQRVVPLRHSDDYLMLFRPPLL